MGHDPRKRRWRVFGHLAPSEAVHREAIGTLTRLRDNVETDQSPFAINGVIGPLDDGYAPTPVMSAQKAEAYQAEQVGWRDTFGAVMVSALTLTCADEAIGLAGAAKTRQMPVAIAFTVKTEGGRPPHQFSCRYH